MIALHLFGCIYISETVWVGDTDDSGLQVRPSAQPQGPDAVGDVTLYDRQRYGYDAAVLSMEHATVIDDGTVNNDWDLLFGNDTEEHLDRFTVNMVTDDQSFIVDLGIIDSLDQIPETIEPADFLNGPGGVQDNLLVLEDHVYLVRTKDADTCQYAMVQVRKHVVDDHVKLHWCRSLEPDRFVPSPECCE